MPASFKYATVARVWRSPPSGSLSASATGAPIGAGVRVRTNAPPCERFSTKSCSSSAPVSYAMVAQATGLASAGRSAIRPSTFAGAWSSMRGALRVCSAEGAACGGTCAASAARSAAGSGSTASV